MCGRQVGADHIDAVERGLGGNAEGVLGEAERLVGDADLEMLGHVAPSQHRTDRLADRRGARSGLRARCTRAAMRASSFSVAASSCARFRARFRPAMGSCTPPGVHQDNRGWRSRPPAFAGQDYVAVMVRGFRLAAGASGG